LLRSDFGALDHPAGDPCYEKLGACQCFLGGVPLRWLQAANYHAASSGFLAEIDRMQLEVREYLSLHPAELKEIA